MFLLNWAPANQPDTKKRKFEAGLYPQLQDLQDENLLEQNSEDWGANAIADLGDDVANANGETPKNGELESSQLSPEEILEDLMEMEGWSKIPKIAVLESDGHALNATMPPPRVEELKLWEPITQDGGKHGYVRYKRMLYILRELNV